MIKNLQVELKFIGDSSGRLTLPKSGYRPQFKFEPFSYKTSGQIEFFSEAFGFDEYVVANVYILGIDYYKEKLFIHQNFTIYEGGRIVGIGKILKIFDVDLLKKDAPFETTLGELVENFDYWMIENKAKGFTIGDKGKKLYWFTTPYPNTGKYRCLGNEDNDVLSWPVFHYPEKKVKIYY